MIKRFYLATIAPFLLLLTQAPVQAQNTNFTARINLGIGIKYNLLDYYDKQIAYSPGGGAGLELGFRHTVVNHIEPYAGVAYQQNIALGYNSGNNTSTESSFYFNRTTFNGGLNYKFALKPGSINWMRLGGGINYSLPGNAKLKEENYSYPKISYRNTSGYHIEASYNVYNTSKISIETGLRYRHIKFDAVNVKAGTPLNLTPAQASGFDVSVIFGLNP